jgi:hypothetical protein
MIESMDTKAHYEQHLAAVYAWMVGDFDENSAAFQELLQRYRVKPQGNKVAIDLGAGHGIQSVALHHAGFQPIAIDFSRQLLDALKKQPESKHIAIKEDDIRNVGSYAELRPELILCWGDTLTHLANEGEVMQLITDCASILSHSGKLMLAFRDYSKVLEGNQRFIHVRSDANTILTCVLEYGKEKVTVNDLLYNRRGDQWEQQLSSYQKLRIAPEKVIALLEKNGFQITVQETESGMQIIVAEQQTNNA